jgi:hypothetical protein
MLIALCQKTKGFGELSGEERDSRRKPEEAVSGRVVSRVSSCRVAQV